MTFDSESAEAADDDYHIEDHHCYNEDRHDNNEDDDSAVFDSESAAATAAALPWEQQTSSNSCLHHGNDDYHDHDSHLNHNEIKLTMMMDEIYSWSETIFKGGENLVLHKKDQTILTIGNNILRQEFQTEIALKTVTAKSRKA